MDPDAVAKRIAQFETMVRPEADPNNDMTWFSLGGAYSDAGRFADAAQAYARCVELNPAFSKAWQMLGTAHIDAGDNPAAIASLTKGYAAAASRGDRMPQKAMGEMLTRLGAAIPQTGPDPATVAPSTGTFMCKRTGRPGRQMTRPPFKGPVGAWIQQNISQETFDNWIRQGTKVINELRLDLSREQDGETYDRHMREFLGIDEDLYAQLMGAAERKAIDT